MSLILHHIPKAFKFRTLLLRGTSYPLTHHSCVTRLCNSAERPIFTVRHAQYNSAMDSRSGIECISVSHHFSGMLCWCTRPQAEPMNSREFWRKDDGMQALLGSRVHPERCAAPAVNDLPSGCVKNSLSSAGTLHLVHTFQPLRTLSLTHCPHSCMIICCCINNCFWGSVKGNIWGWFPSPMCSKLQESVRELAHEKI